MKKIHKAFKESGIEDPAIIIKAHSTLGTVDVYPDEADEAKELLQELGYDVHSLEELKDNVAVMLDEADEPVPFTRIEFGKRVD